MRNHHLGSLVLIAALLGSIPSNAVSATAGSDDALAEGGVITIIVDSPPSIAANLDARLRMDGVDITDEKCGPLEVAAESPLPTRQCTGLDDGSYFIAPTGHPDNTGFPLPRRCRSADRVFGQQSGLWISEQIRAWTCTITVAPPGVVIDLQREIPGVPAAVDLPVYDIDILDANGLVVSDDCEVDPRFSDALPRRWCTGLADGSYSTRPIDVPDGVIAEARCGFVDSFDGRRNATGFFLPTEDEAPFFICIGAVQLPSLTIRLSLESGPFPAHGWSQTLSVLLLDPSGADVTAQCSPPVEPGRGVTPADLECFNLAPGVYSVSVDGLDDGQLIVNSCETVEVVPEGSRCAMALDGEKFIVPTTLPPTTTPPPTTPTTLVTVLPETGTPSSNTALIAAMTVSAGFALVLVSRRRSYS